MNFRREDPRDALILNKKWSGKTLATLPSGSVIGKYPSINVGGGVKEGSEVPH